MDEKAILIQTEISKALHNRAILLKKRASLILLGISIILFGRDVVIDLANNLIKTQPIKGENAKIAFNKTQKKDYKDSLIQLRKSYIALFVSNSIGPFNVEALPESYDCIEKKSYYDFDEMAKLCDDNFRQLKIIEQSTETFFYISNYSAVLLIERASEEKAKEKLINQYKRGIDSSSCRLKTNSKIPNSDLIRTAESQIQNEQLKHENKRRKINILYSKDSVLLWKDKQSINISSDLIKWVFLFSLNKTFPENYLDEGYFNSMLKNDRNVNYEFEYQAYSSKFKKILSALVECLYDKEKRKNFYPKIKMEYPSLFLYLTCLETTNISLFKPNDLILIK